MHMSVANVVIIFSIFSSAEPYSGQPHIVFFVVDDLGWNDVGYHNSYIKTPTIDMLAKSGVRLNNYYVASHCVPSRNMLISGRHVIDIGLQHGEIGYYPRGLPLDEFTIADKLKEIGYATHLIGKWHCGCYSNHSLPHNRGFDTFFGYLGSSDDHYTHIIMSNGLADLRLNDECVGYKYFGDYSTIMYANEAKNIIAQHDENKPLFLMLAFSAVHKPIQVPDVYMQYYKSTIHDNERRTYAGMASCVDEAIANITEALENKGMLKNSVIVLTTDNGGGSVGNNWPLRGRKNSHWEGGVRGVAFVYSDLLPMDVRGTENSELMHITDWFPTLVKLGGGNPCERKNLYGVDQWEMIRGMEPSARGEVLIALDTTRKASEEYRTGPFKYDKFDITTFAAIKMGKWKLLTGDSTYRNFWDMPDPEYGVIDDEDFDDTRMVRLYDLVDDPSERTDVSEERQDIVHEMLAKLDGYEKAAVPPQMQTKPRLDNHVLECMGPWID
ncbi:arylsulfatase B-like [Saccoglossus kowalevskii]|uniref:Arylsulfatase B-like n=1 Tax=Saccoglossus kowalevskii TaxID=10224 RepID=A0ABM0GZI7_SACKO|nr:PREDICTED: arylsulfatase B-like [Saccoglossus kowalevskii]